MPICRGPSECVERRVKEQRFGASATLTGMRSLRHRLEMCVAVTNEQIVLGTGCDYLPEPFLPPAVMKTASTTPSTSARPSVVRSSSVKLRLSHLTSPASILLAKP